jgi:hypothetical protein
VNIIPIQQIFYDVFNLFDEYHLYSLLGCAIVGGCIASRIFFDALIDFPSWFVGTLLTFIANIAGMLSFAFFFDLTQMLSITVPWQIALHVLAFVLPVMILGGIYAFFLKAYYFSLLFAIVLTTLGAFSLSYVGKLCIHKFYEIETNIHDLDKPQDELPR